MSTTSCSSTLTLRKTTSAGTEVEPATTAAERVGWLRAVDRLGIGLSGLCAVHCALTPLLVLAMPFVGGHEFEEGLRVVLGGLGIVAIGFGMALHRRWEVGMWLGLALVLFAALSLLHLSALPEVSLSIAASAALIRAHWLNSRACKQGC